MPLLFCDTETYSPVNLKNGTHAYAEQAEVMLFAYAIDDGPVRVADLTSGDSVPVELYDPAYTVALHNSHFDRTVIRHALGYSLTTDRVHDTMVQALSHGLPGSLDKLCEIYHLPVEQAKSKSGKNLIQLFCKPLKGGRRATRLTHPADWQDFIEYARLDIEAMRVLYNKMPLWNYKGVEHELWELDQAINDRGFAVDVALAEAAVAALVDERGRLSEEAQELTLGAVTSATQRDALLTFLRDAHGVDLPDLRGPTVEKALEDERLPPGVRELLVIRTQASTTSTSKYKKLLAATSSDARLRGTLQFAGANRTLRWAGRTFQPQNLPRPALKAKQVETAILGLKTGMAPLMYENLMEAASSCLRGCIVAEDGNKLVVSDLSNIEGRDAAWLAGEEWKLQAFRAFDNGEGPDLYCLAYAKSFGIRPEEVTKAQRQVGKVQELALQYQGGVGAFLTFALVYGINLDELAEIAWAHIPEHIKEQAASTLRWNKKKRRSTLGLPDKTWIVCESFKLLWREAHPAISSMWGELENAVKLAIATPGKTHTVRKIKLQVSGTWLRMLLPSGLYLCYPSPALEDGKIAYLGVNQYSRKWGRLYTYGGKLFENLAQATAREVMARNMLRINRAGYNIVLSVHDELLTEVPDSDEFSVDGLSELLATPPEWCADMPLAAAGFEAYRYRKD